MIIATLLALYVCKATAPTPVVARLTTQQEARDVAEARKWVGKKVWVYRGVLSMNWQLGPDEPSKIVGVRRLSGTSWLRYGGGEGDSSAERGFSAANPLEVTLEAPKHRSMIDESSPAHGLAPSSVGSGVFRIIVADWWHLRLCVTRTNPIPKKIRQAFLSAIRQGRVLKGMPKALALVAWGHPDWGQSTPAESYASDSWIREWMTGYWIALYLQHGKVISEESSKTP